MSVPAGAVDTSLSDIFLRLPPGSCRLGRGLRHTAVKQARPEPAAKLPLPPPPPPLPPLSQTAPSRRGGRACDPATLLKKGRACAPSRAASWLVPFPCSRLALFPPPSRQFARRGGIRWLSRAVFRTSPFPTAVSKKKRRNSKGCALTPFLLPKTFQPQSAQSFVPRPAARTRKSVEWTRPPMFQGMGGDTRSHLLL
ncbi:zyxin-like [Canis lupus familiaris]|uniref:zyxin-like n=1 Tax=Canis lupus familiaris TaxID=9615 RepID=UPI0015F1646B|nr:zyxin-like [Canis lupus familiaris]XP_038285771.1 zyxin-like [Canis lupus familiaris]XP_038285772.1 zyxin-like [Canis lupus familiaris]XP_038312254.1 zyxin-like [Canis lupus familiaris]XP_038312255.1 zyxin-like [Canis lupus familiaris]XP_038312256.1 zyxin-like [Canis lupus familiaris]XP_038424306.1 zyxin-like [Canis lupus familiaris]XP_038424307.1 zyxin-like [Canis lupus familiaris]XP_038424308.1 zyxin-like [Canis lupus familiaris]